MSAQKRCPSCGTEYPADERFCPRDGSALRSQDGGTDLVGSIVAERYHVIRKLGEGGMGQVYLAEHVKMGRRSAVKVMHPGMVNDADAISRFNREAANACRINHPNVAGIYDFGETADGVIYLAMEYVAGDSLTSIVKASGALPPMRAAKIARQVADGLRAAHELGIVHRDLKPDNIMITLNRDGSDGVKIVDFGIAKAAGSELQKVTRTGMVVGTPEYMSPEQLAGDALDPRSDVYSLALVTFNMLTGALPFPSDTVQESMLMRLTDRPRSLAEMNAAVSWSDAVQAVMQRALERDPAQRYQTASRFGDALVQAIEGMPTTAIAAARVAAKAPAPPAATPVAAAPASVASRSRAPMVIGGGVIAAAIVGGSLFAMTRAHASPRPAEPIATPVTRPPVTVAPPSPEASLTTTAPAAGDSASASIDTLLTRLDRWTHSERTAGAALGEADAMQSRVTTTEQRAYLGVIRAQAYGTLGQDERSCQELKGTSNTSKGTRYEQRLSDMLHSCP